MKRTLVSDLKNHIGETIKTQGFVQSLRDQKKVQFLIVRDISGTVQIFNEKTEDRVELTSQISSLTTGSAVEIVGKVILNPQIKLGGLEVVIETIKIESMALPTLPINEKSSLDAIMDYRWLSLRSPENKLVFEVQTTMEMAMREFWMKNSFIEIHSPKLMESASEGGAELFKISYFGREACLAQSPQFYKQMAMASGFDKVFEIGPVFRANPSFTPRHDTEFTSVDVEVSWVDSHEDVMRIEEEWIRYFITAIANKHGEEIEKICDHKVAIPMLPFPRVTLEQARNMVAQCGHAIDHKEDLDPEGERTLSARIKEIYGHEFVFVTDYPTSVRPFYHMRPEENPLSTKSFDLIWNGLEVTTGAQREHRIERLEAQAIEKDVDLKSIEHYLNFFRYGCPPHGGYGFGLTRALMILLGRSNVREVTYLYRGPNRLVP